MSTYKAVIRKIGRDITLMTAYRMTPQERRRIPTDIPDVMDLGNMSHAWCWINCSMRLTKVDLEKLRLLVTGVAKTSGRLNQLAQMALQKDSVVTAEDSAEAQVLWAQLMTFRSELERLRAEYSAKHPHLGSAVAVARPEEGPSGASGGDRWAVELARIYKTHFGPTAPVTVAVFVSSLGAAIDSGDISRPNAVKVHEALSEFGRTRAEVIANLADYIKKNRAGLPEAFTTLLR